jgi:hypothetical protein
MRAVALALVLTVSLADAEVVQVHGLAPAELAELQQDLDFWGLDPATGAAVFDVAPADRSALEARGLDVRSDDRRQRELDQWRARAPTRTRADAPDTIPGYPCYRTVARTHADLAALADAHPGRAEWIEIGPTWQAQAGDAAGDAIHALRLANAASPHPKPPLVVLAAQHARELTTAEIATRFAELLIGNPGDDPDVDWLLDHRSIHIIAQANPDGRRQVEQGTSLWRKNHNATACGEGTWPGVDLNRNGRFLWQSDADTCSQLYPGPALASEPETRAVQNYLATVFDAQRPAADLVTPAPDTAEGVFVSLHSFGEYVLIPWEGLGGQNENNAPNHDGLMLLGRRFGDRTGYAVGRWSLLPPAEGTAVDYAYGEFGVAAYTFEVGTTFLQSCESFEATIWPSIREALLLAARAARRPYLEPRGPAVAGLAAFVDDGRWVIAGSADDGRYSDGGIGEPPQPTPVGTVVEVRLAAGAPPPLGDDVLSFPVDEPATTVSFEIDWPVGTPLPTNRRVFVTAVDDSGLAGLPRMLRLGDLIHGNGFEAIAQ